MSVNTTPGEHVCRHHKEGTACSAVRLLEERVRKLEDQAHASFHQRLKAPPRKRTVRKPAVSLHPTVKRKSENPVCPGCGVPLDPDQIASIPEAICTACNTYFFIS